MTMKIIGECLFWPAIAETGQDLTLVWEYLKRDTIQGYIYLSRYPLSSVLRWKEFILDLQIEVH